MFDSFVREPDGCCIVNLDGCWALRVDHFFKGYSEWAGILCVEEGGDSFGFHCQAHDVVHYFGKDVDRGVGCWFVERRRVNVESVGRLVFWSVAEEKNPLAWLRYVGSKRYNALLDIQRCISLAV